MKRHNALLYPAHEAQRYGLNTFFKTLRAGLHLHSTLASMAELCTFNLPYASMVKDYLFATHEMTHRFAKAYVKPAFGLHQVEIAGKKVSVQEETILEKPFCHLLHFKRETRRNDPKLLIVAPMSGHHATLLRDTVAQMLPAHDVYITDWLDARDVPMSAGPFGLDDYVAYVKEFIEALGPKLHVMAVCQPTVPVMIATALLAAEKSPAQPLSMTLMGGPLNPQAAETKVTSFADQKHLGWFRENLIASVPLKYRGAGRLVYPGFMQLLSFIEMNRRKHVSSHFDMFRTMINGEHEKAGKLKKFYDEYLAVCDIPAEFYLDTVDRIFIRNELARGVLEWRGQRVNLQAVTKTAMFTIEGEKDDISAPGQTVAGHVMCGGLKKNMHYHLLQEGAGNYGIFNGRLWQGEISPRVTGFIRHIGKRNGLKYAPAPNAVAPAPWPARKKARKN
ncbi:MAG: polyhydroxyalkanoate depolymerase [Alphaproteobacteria bacterium]|nr:polyhydroxyalkanoate depolymerase [Alphaproteobacteria bacterium]